MIRLDEKRDEVWGVWFVDRQLTRHRVDFAAIVYRRSGSAIWEATYRLRYHRDPNSIGTEDEVTWGYGHHPGGDGSELALWVDKLTLRMATESASSLHRLITRSSARDAFDRLAREPWGEELRAA